MTQHQIEGVAFYGSIALITVSMFLISWLGG